MDSHDYYLGFDLSTQQLKGVVVRSDLKLVHSATVDFDTEYAAKYGTAKGTLSNPAEGEIYMPVAMWLEAIDLVLTRLRDKGLDFSKVKCLAGAGMQHGTVFWSREAHSLLASLDPGKSLVAQLEPAFSHPHSPNWQDSSTQVQCDAFNAALGGPQPLADLTGSQAHHRFSGPQIMRFRTKYPDHYDKTARISLVSSFIATVFTGRFAPIDISDVCGMNLWDIKAGAWHEALLALTAGGKDAVPTLKERLGHVPEDGGLSLGNVAPYFVNKYGFDPACTVAPSTGDNPATILSLPLRADDAMVSLGTSTTFLMSTSAYVPDPAYHFMNHPTTAGLYMFMLCYKNGGLAREHIRDALNATPTSTPAPPPKSWTAFDAAATAAPPLGTPDITAHPAKLGLYFPLHEIVPSVPPGQWNFTYAPATHTLAETGQAAPWHVPTDHARAILESQLLSLRLRSRALARTQTQTRADGQALPPQPRRVYLVGGGSVNAAIARVAGEVLGGAEGVFRLELGGNACALGAAYKAAWARERRVAPAASAGDEIRGGRDTETFEAFVGERWDEGQFVRKVDEGYRPGVYELYGEALPGFEEMERRVLDQVARGAAPGVRRASVSYGTQAPAAGQV